MTTETDPLTILRKPFPPGQVGKLPRVTCGACSKGRGTCDKHQKASCKVCGAYVSTQHMHLDYVGHADVTLRLLEADPHWSWEPYAEDEHGLPLLDLDDNGQPVGMWIRLTVGGVTRPGYGSCPSGQGDAVKVLLGDGLRNAAMRFGVAVDLWAKGDRADPTTENATASGGATAQRPARRQTSSGGDGAEALMRARAAMWEVWRETHGDDREALERSWAESHGGTLVTAGTADQITAFTARLRREASSAEASTHSAGRERGEAQPDVWGAEPPAATPGASS